MNKVSPSAVSHSKNLTFEFSETLRGESINLNDYSDATYIIDVDGTVYQGASASEQNASVLKIGFIDKFINEKIERPTVNFYMSEQQKVTIYKIIKELAAYFQDSTISSSNEMLDQGITSLYNNYCG